MHDSSVSQSSTGLLWETLACILINVSCSDWPNEISHILAFTQHTVGSRLHRRLIDCFLYRHLFCKKPPYHTTPQPFYGHFFRTTGVSRCQKKTSSGLYGATEDNKRQIHRQSRLVPLHLDQSATHLHQPPIFTPDALPVATLPIYSGLGQAQEYAGLHIPRALLLCGKLQENSSLILQ